jgi:hypothetical protein
MKECPECHKSWPYHVLTCDCGCRFSGHPPGEIQKAVESLMACFKFESDDLAANHHGELSPAQHKRLARENRFAQFCFFYIFVPPVAVVSVMFIFFAATGTTGTAGCTMPFLLIGLPAAWLIYTGYLRSRALRSDLLNGKVAAIRGLVQLSKARGEKGRPHYYLSVKDHRFRIGHRQYALCKEMPFRVFTVYYAPQSDILLSLEPGDVPLDDHA